MKKFFFPLIALILFFTIYFGFSFFSPPVSEQEEDFSAVLSMTDDVIHNYYEEETKEFYEWRHEKTLEKMAETHWTDSIPLYNDLAVEFEKLGEHKKAKATLEEKRRILEKVTSDISQAERNEHFYTYHANLGTFLIHHGITEKDQEEMAEGADHIAKAIDINKDAHFGRENYQLIAVQNFLLSFDDSEFFQKKNLLGEKTLNEKWITEVGTSEQCGKIYLSYYPEVKKIGKNEQEQILDSCPMALKGILGMIRLGGGPNPYSFATMGDILIAQGEVDLAAASYLRSIEMNHPYSTDIEEYVIQILKNEEKKYEDVFAEYKRKKSRGDLWKEGYKSTQRALIEKGKNPREKESYEKFYEEWGNPRDK